MMLDVSIVEARWPSSFPRRIVSGTRVYYAASLLSALSVSLPHAVLTPILLAKGVTLSEIALIQIFYSLSVFIAEVPSGVIADSLGRKNVYIVSKIFLSIFGVLVFVTSSVPVLCLAWFIYGVANALESGTIGNEVILAVRKFCRRSKLGAGAVIHYLVRVDARFETIGMIIGGLVGSTLYAFVGDGLYLGVCGTTIFVALFVLAIFHLNATDFEDEGLSGSQSAERMVDLVKRTLCDALLCLRNPTIRKVIFAIAITQVFFQVHFQFWQAYFLQKGVEPKYFGIVYVVLQSISVLVSFLGTSAIAYLRNSRWAKVTLGFVGVVSLTGMFSSSRLALAAYLVFVFGFWIIVFYADAHFRSLASEDSLSTLTSVSSAVARAASMITLGALSLLLKFFTVTTLVPIFFLAAGVFLVLLALSKT
ncbi:MAG: MFS transporter [Propionibacteriaceae bacterium]